MGDTINVAFRMPGEILNEGTSTFVKLSHVDIRTLSSISRIDLPITIPELRGDVFHNFQLITYPQSVGQVRLVRINDFSSDAESVPLRNTHGDYVFNYSLVAKTAGLYSFGFGSINFGEELGFQENIVEIEGECNTTKQLYTILQNPLPGNLDLRCESNVIDYCISDEPRRTEAYETYRKRANHVFRVVE
ncbi:hypothetical protein QWY85_07580 [Neolewinella lacunae]|uniref:Uncharacterized protein n=1 Tax=Neolewinella lacunae TaxID=1517758 RepID=A0A923PNN2_9BACT|nr:hypothetical protein [Neolewinella lacunae]MBC6994639.1 hypothetical protein [Neolewinella lacunae]MDN3634511.1 hypothetical protein [Neolewinella lacunae]